MGMVFGFGQHRRRMLEAELARIAGELPALGAMATYLVSDFARTPVQPDTELELLVVRDSDEAFHRRPDFFLSHIRPRLGVRLFVYTPDEFDRLAATDPLIRRARARGVVVDGPA